MTRKYLVGLVVVAAGLAAACETSGLGPTFPSSRVVNYAGSWKGNYVVSGCNETGEVALSNRCAVIGSAPGFTLTLTQDRRTVAGSFTLNSVQFPTTGGTVASDDTLSLSSTAVSSTGVVTVATLSLKRVDNSLEGVIRQRVTEGGVSGEANIVGGITTSGR